MLASASYDQDSFIALLTFDRDVDLSGVDASAFVVRDGLNARTMAGSGTAYFSEPGVVTVPLVIQSAYVGPDTLLDVGAGNGIVAADDGGTWAGVAGLVLPWP